MTSTTPAPGAVAAGSGGAALVQRLRAAGCVFAEQEAAVLLATTRDPAALEELTRRREAGQPLEHVVGWVDFGALRLTVRPGVFVPRQRSLLLARTAAALARAQPAPVLVEAFAGVGPIAASVARAVTGVEVHAVDVDPRAAQCARVNLPPGAGVHTGPLLEALPASLEGRVTLLVAVPPYVPTTAADQLPREAVEHEPARALFGGADGLDRLRDLLDHAAWWLAPTAAVLVELHTGQYRAAAAHARSTGFCTRRRDGGDGQTALLQLHLPGGSGHRP